MESLGRISTLVWYFPGVPSTFRMNGEAFPFFSLISLMFKMPFCGFFTIRYRVDDPMVVNTVSKRMESAEKIRRAEGEDMILFFLHEAVFKIIRSTVEIYKSSDFNFFSLTIKQCDYCKNNKIIIGVPKINFVKLDSKIRFWKKRNYLIYAQTDSFFTVIRLFLTVPVYFLFPVICFLNFGFLLMSSLYLFLILVFLWHRSVYIRFLWSERQFVWFYQHLFAWKQDFPFCYGQF